MQHGLYLFGHSRTLHDVFIKHFLQITIYIFIDANNTPTIYGSNLSVIAQSEEAKKVHLKPRDILQSIATQHPKVNSSQLIGIDAKCNIFTIRRQTEVKMDNSFFIHQVDTVDHRNYIPIIFPRKRSFIERELIGYPLLLRLDVNQKRITAKKLHQEVSSVISSVITNNGKHEDDAFTLNAVLIIRNIYYDTWEKYLTQTRVFEIKDEDTEFEPDLTQIERISVSVKSESSIKDSFRCFSIFNCPRDAITAPVQEFMSVSYGLVGNPDDTIFEDKRIDVTMTCGQFKNYITQKHQKWIADTESQCIAFADHPNVAADELLTSIGKEPIRLQIEQTDNCLIQ